MKLPNIVLQAQAFLSDNDLRICSPDNLAEHLGISVEAMRFNLKDKGTSYRELMELERYTRAYVEVSDNPDISVNDLMELLAYSDAQSMYKAFKR